MKAPFSSKDEFIKQNLPLIHFVAKRFYGKAKVFHVEYDDLYSAGCVGLVKAYNGFDPSKGFQFSTYAITAINCEIRSYLLGNYPINIPKDVKGLAKKIRWHDFESKPVAIIANYFACSIQMAERALESLKIRVSSIDCPIPGEESNRTIQDLIFRHEDFTVTFLNDFLETLTTRERIIVLGRMEGLIQKEIGQRLGVSQVHVSRLLQNISEKLSQYVKQAG